MRTIYGSVESLNIVEKHDGSTEFTIPASRLYDPAEGLISVTLQAADEWAKIATKDKGGFIAAWRNGGFLCCVFHQPLHQQQVGIRIRADGKDHTISNATRICEEYNAPEEVIALL